MVDPRYISVFNDVVNTGSYSAAARRSGFSQPAISQQMRALERAVGTPLFIRSGRRLCLTEAGEILARHAHSVLADLSAATNQIAAITELRSGGIRICAFPSASATIVPAAAARASQQRPGLRVRLEHAEPGAAVDRLRRGGCDIALAYNYPGIGDQQPDPIVQVAVMSDPLVAVVPAHHRVAHQGHIDLADLAAERWITGGRRNREQFLRSCAHAGFEPDIAFTTDDNLAVQSFVAHGLGVALVPSLVLSFIRHPDVRSRRVRGVEARRIFAYAQRDYHQIPTIAGMLEALRQVGEEMLIHP